VAVPAASVPGPALARRSIGTSRARISPLATTNRTIEAISQPSENENRSRTSPNPTMPTSSEAQP
jgi:hypothetical protein